MPKVDTSGFDNSDTNDQQDVGGAEGKVAYIGESS